MPSARAAQVESAGDPEAAAADQPPTEPPAPRQAEPEAAPTQQAPPKRTRKGKPVMPSWDEVLLGVRSQR